MQSRFHAEPIVQATELLLQERTPRDVLVARPRAEEVQRGAGARTGPARRAPVQHSARATPRTQLLSNGRYAVMLTSAGSGYSRWRDIAITRWREDAHAGLLGVLHLLARRANRRGLVGRLPAQRGRAGLLRSRFFEDHAEIIRRDRSHHHHAGGGRFVGRRCRDAPRFDHQSGRAHARNPGHFLCRVCARAASGRRGASGLFQFVRGDGICARRGRAAGDAPANAPKTKRRCGSRTCWPWKARPLASCNTRPTAPDFWDEGITSATPFRSSMAARFPIPWAPCSIRS